MQNKRPYELDFEQYVRNVEPAKKEKSYAWSTAIGLQQVDGFTPSKYLFDTARRSIDGEITIAEAKSLIDAYYASKSGQGGFAKSNCRCGGLNEKTLDNPPNRVILKLPLINCRRTKIARRTVCLI